MPTSRTGTFKASRKGFTLLELAVAVFIMALVLGIAMPSFYSLTKDGKLSSEAKKTASILRHLNETAISEKTDCSITFDFAVNKVSWKTETENKSEKITTLSGASIPSRGRVHDGILTVFFGPLGAMEDITVYLSDNTSDGKDGKTKGFKVRLSRTTGRVKVIADER